MRTSTNVHVFHINFNLYFSAKMEEKRMESLYSLININTERKKVKSQLFYIVSPLSPFPK